MNQHRLADIGIVLVEPAGELNLGSIARVMKNMGLSRLVLVNPRCDRHCESARIMAVHAADVLENAVVVDSLPAALAGYQQAIATTARSRSVQTELETPRSLLPELVGSKVKVALLFGPEDRGLSNDELKYAQRFIRIPSNPEYPSLNLAQAVAVCVYELYQAWWQGEDRSQSESLPNIGSSIANAPLEVLESYYRDLEALLLEIGYLYPHTATVKMEKFRRIYNKANLQPEEVALLRGILRQVRWAINERK